MNTKNLQGLRQWKCQNGHVLGVIERMEMNEAGQKRQVTRLLLFRQAIDPMQGNIQDADVIASVEGTTFDVRCSVIGCCETRSWFIGEDAIQRLLQRVVCRSH